MGNGGHRPDRSISYRTYSWMNCKAIPHSPYVVDRMMLDDRISNEYVIISDLTALHIAWTVS